VFVGLRWETGNDWRSYLEYYQHIESLHDSGDRFEPGFRVVNLAARDLALPFAGFNLIYAATYLGLMFLSFRRDDYRISGWLILQMFAPFLLGLMGTTRQVMALAICMFSVRYVLTREGKKFLLCIAAAAAFHISALAFLVAWPLPKIRLTPRRVWATLGVLIAASVLNAGTAAVNFAEQRVAVLRLADLAGKIEAQQESSAQEFDYAAGAAAPLLTRVSRLGFLALFIVLFPMYSEETDQLYLKLYVVSIVVVVLLSGAVYVLAERVAIYFAIFQIYLLALPTIRAKSLMARRLFCVGLLTLSLAHLFTGLYLRNPRAFVPYKGVLINRDVRRDPGWFDR
jgi:hypothetical protein